MMGKVVALNGSFNIKYVPNDRFRRQAKYPKLPFGAEILLGSQYLKLTKHNVLHPGYLFSPAEYMETVAELHQGSDVSITLNEESPIPLKFEPIGTNCKVSIEKDKISSDVYFDKDKVRPQIVTLDSAVVNLARLQNDFLTDLHSRGAYELLDDIRSEFDEDFVQPPLANMLRRNGVEVFQFDDDAYKSRFAESLAVSLPRSDNVTQYMQTLRPAGVSNWNDLVHLAKSIDPKASSDSVYASLRSTQPKH